MSWNALDSVTDIAKSEAVNYLPVTAQAQVKPKASQHGIFNTSEQISRKCCIGLH
jgi:hypothetical protein